MIDAKLKGEGIDLSAEAPTPPASNVIDLMAALKKSLGQDAEVVPATSKARKGPRDRRQSDLKLPIKGGKTAEEQPAAKPARKRA